MFTQPLMYSKIRKMKPVLEKYAEKLICEEVITEEVYKVNISIINLGSTRLLYSSDF